MGVVREVLDAAESRCSGRSVYVNGQRGRAGSTSPCRPTCPYGFAASRSTRPSGSCGTGSPGSGVHDRARRRLVSFEQDATASATVVAPRRRATSSRARYLVGCDGAHSTVRKALGPELRGRRVPRAVHARRRGGGLVAAARLRASVRCTRRGRKTDDVLVCVPLPGHRPIPHVDARTPNLPTRGRRPRTGSRTGSGRRARPSWPTSRRWSTGCRRSRRRLRDLRWSSVFRISHRIVDRVRPRPGVRRRRRGAHPSAHRRRRA